MILPLRSAFVPSAPVASCGNNDAAEAVRTLAPSAPSSRAGIVVDVLDGGAVRASANASRHGEARAVPASGVTTLGPTLAARAHLIRAYAYVRDALAEGFGDAELAVLALAFAIGFAYWLADERVRELLWRAL